MYLLAHDPFNLLLLLGEPCLKIAHSTLMAHLILYNWLFHWIKALWLVQRSFLSTSWSPSCSKMRWDTLSRRATIRLVESLVTLWPLHHRSIQIIITNWIWTVEILFFNSRCNISAIFLISLLLILMELFKVVHFLLDSSKLEILVSNGFFGAL